MPPDDEPDLKSAFVALHRREREAAPLFSVMQQRALQGDDGRPSAKSTAPLFWLGAAPAAVSLLIVALWWTNYTIQPLPVKTARAGSAQRVEQLLTSIEHHLESDEALSPSAYPTDALLTRTETDLAP